LRRRGGQAEAAGPGRRALPQPRAVDSPSRRRLGGGLDRRRRCAAVVVAWSGGGVEVAGVRAVWRRRDWGVEAAGVLLG